jgi:hypothetical protein
LTNNVLNSVDAGTSKITTPESISTKPEKIPGSSLPGEPARLDEYNPQLGQSFDSTPSSDRSSKFEPGMSIEQLLADSANAMDSILDDDLMSMWMAAPTDMA